MFFVYLGKRVKYVNFIRAFGEPKKTRNCLFEGATLFFFWIGVIWLKTRIPPWFFRKFHPLFFVAEDYCCPPEAFCSSKKSHPFFLPISHIIPSGGWLIHFGGGGFFWGQPWIWILASHKSSRFGHLASWMFVPAGLATCFNGATRRYLELCALPKHLRLRTTSTTLLKKPETVMFQKKAPWSWENFINYPCYPKNWQ